MSEVKDYPPYLDYPKPRKKQTNADRIRMMTDEELAIFQNDIMRDWEGGTSYVMSRFFPSACIVDWLDWLKQEVSE